MIKAIFLDVDGTLVSFSTHKVPVSALEALRRVHESGVRIIIATGRASTDLNEISAVPYDAVVALNGAECVLRDGTEVSVHPIPREDFIKSLALSGKYGFPLALETRDGVQVDRMSPEVMEVARTVAHPVPEVVNIRDAFHASKCCQMCFYCSPDVEKEVMAQLPGLSASRWHPLFADINVRGVDKGTGMAEFARHYRFGISETMAFGDGGNDIPMLRAAGIGIAMGSASEEVREAADYVTGPVDDDGIRNALLRFGLIV